MDAGLDNSSCIVLLPAIHGSIRQHDEIKAFLCALCVSVVNAFRVFNCAKRVCRPA